MPTAQSCILLSGFALPFPPSTDRARLRFAGNMPAAADQAVRHLKWRADRCRQLVAKASWQLCALGGALQAEGMMKGFYSRICPFIFLTVLVRLPPVQRSMLLELT